MNAVLKSIPRQEREELAREHADELLRSDQPRMAEIVNEAAGIWDTNWLTEALIHAHRTGDWQYVKRQCEQHIEPALLDELERDLERNGRDPR